MTSFTQVRTTGLLRVVTGCLLVFALCIASYAQQRELTETRISSGQFGLFRGNSLEVRLASVNRDDPPTRALIRIVDANENVLAQTRGLFRFRRPLALTLDREDIDRLGNLFTIRVEAVLRHPVANNTGRSIMTVQTQNQSAATSLVAATCPVPGGDLPPQEPETEFLLICGDCGCTIISTFTTP